MPNYGGKGLPPGVGAWRAQADSLVLCLLEASPGHILPEHPTPSTPSPPRRRQPLQVRRFSRRGQQRSARKCTSTLLKQQRRTKPSRRPPTALPCGRGQRASRSAARSLATRPPGAQQTRMVCAKRGHSAYAQAWRPLECRGADGRRGRPQLSVARRPVHKVNARPGGGSSPAGGTVGPSRSHHAPAGVWVGSRIFREGRARQRRWWRLAPSGRARLPLSPPGCVQLLPGADRTRRQNHHPSVGVSTGTTKGSGEPLT